MKLRRKFNLAEVGKQYETIEVEVEGDVPANLIGEIDRVYRYYLDQIKRGVIR